MIRRIDQQLKVNKLMIEKFDLWKVENEKCRQYMYNYVEIITMVSTIMCLIDGSDELLKKKEDLWNYIKETDVRLYKKLRHGIFGTVMNLPGKLGRKIAITCYHIAQKVIGFN